MKWFVVFCCVFGMQIGFVQASDLETGNAVRSILELQQFDAQSLINWKIGDALDLKVTLGFGMEGSMHKEAFKEEGNAIWVRQQMSLAVQNDNSEMLIDRDSGKVLKFIHNGKEEAIPDGKLEIISTKNEVIEVPAGKFRVIHLTAKTKEGTQIEIWANPNEIALDGTAKVFLDQGMMKVTMVLTKSVKR